MRLEFHPEAELELIEAAAYYERKYPGWVNASLPRLKGSSICCSTTPRSVPALKASFAASV